MANEFTRNLYRLSQAARVAWFGSHHVVANRLGRGTAFAEGGVKVESDYPDRRVFFAEMQKLFERDWKNIEDGLYAAPAAIDRNAFTAFYDSLDFLRLVHVSPSVLPFAPPVRHTNGPVRTGWIWERVAGARLEIAGASGERVQLTLELECPTAGERWSWVGSAVVGDDGVARVRVPYSTDVPNGDTRARGPLRVQVGARTLDVAVRETDVRAGNAVAVR